MTMSRQSDRHLLRVTEMLERLRKELSIAQVLLDRTKLPEEVWLLTKLQDAIQTALQGLTDLRNHKEALDNDSRVLNTVNRTLSKE